MPHSLSRADLLSQQDYAKAITRRIDGSVTASWISKATKNGKTVASQFRPDLDAVFDGDQLAGYREPQDRSGRQEDPPAEAAEAAAQRQNGQHSRNGITGGESPGDDGTDTRRNRSHRQQAKSYRQQANMQAYERGDGLEEAATSLAKILSNDRATFRSTAKVGVTLGTTWLFWGLGNRGMASAIFGLGVGFGLATIFIPQPQA